MEDNGQIKYNGEPINKFYIDGSDFMDGRYGIATENIHPADVASVDVLENHQPIQVLKGLEFSQQAGLNIKLKEEARHKWITLLNGGVGVSPLLYDASLFAMRVAGKRQNMESVRVNDTGWNPASQSRLQMGDDLFGGYVDVLWDDYIEGTLALRQKAETPLFRVTNDLQVMKRIDDHLLTLSSRNRYALQPHSLWVSGTEESAQEMTSGDFRSVTEARYGWIRGCWKVYARGGVDFNHHDMKSDLTGWELPYIMQNNLHFSLLNTYLSPEVAYHAHRWRVTGSAPVSYHLHHIRDVVAGSNTTHHYGAVTPSLHVRHQVNARMELSARLRYSLTPPQAKMFVPGVIMTDFRNVHLSEPTTEYRDTRSVMMKFKYRNPITSLFFSATGRFEWSTHPYMLSQQFIDDYIVGAYIPMKNEGNHLSVNGSVSKGLMSLSTGSRQTTVWSIHGT